MIRTASYRPNRWFRPPPHRTAYFSSARQPGVVLRVSRIAAFVPSTSATNRAVRVAIPLSRWRKFKAVRSQARSERIEPETRAISRPGSTPGRRPREPSPGWNPSSKRAASMATTGSPATTPSDRLTSRADPLALAGIVR